MYGVLWQKMPPPANCIIAIVIAVPSSSRISYAPSSQLLDLSRGALLCKEIEVLKSLSADIGGIVVTAHRWRGKEGGWNVESAARHQHTITIRSGLFSIVVSRYLVACEANINKAC